MTRILLYNITGEKLMKIRVAALRLGLQILEIPEESFAHPLGYLMGLPDFAPSEEKASFSEEMLVMETLSSPLLDALRQSGATVALKDVVTAQNLSWSSAALCRELAREHKAMKAHVQKKNVHPHRKKK